MLAQPLLLLSLASLGLSQTAWTAPATYHKVYITSMVDKKFVIAPKTAKAGNTIVVQALTSKPEQQWLLALGDSKVQLANTTLCLDAGAKAAWKDMANVYVKDCTADADPSQLWTVMADGRIALKASSPREFVPYYRVVDYAWGL